MVARQALRLASSSADKRGAALAAGVWVAWARASEDEIGPASRLAANITLRNLATRPRGELEYFMGCPLTNEPNGGRGHAAAPLLEFKSHGLHYYYSGVLIGMIRRKGRRGFFSGDEGMKGFARSPIRPFPTSVVAGRGV
jgi:hypothetical protein